MPSPEAHARYSASEKGKARFKRYRATPKGRATMRAAVSRYEASTKGILRQERAYQKKRGSSVQD